MKPLPRWARLGRALLWFAMAVSVVGAVFAQTASQGPDDEKKKKEKKESNETVVLSPFEVSNSVGGYSAGATLAGTRLGVTPGGMKDVNYARDLLSLGMLPLPGEFTAEGLFSEYDLPLPAVDAGDKLLRVTGAGKRATIVGQPDVTHLVQIGFSSSLTIEHFKRDPLFLVLVLDVSGSMEPKLDLLKQTAQTVLGKLHQGDAVAVVVFSDGARTVVTPALYDASGWEQVRTTVNGIAIEGGTNVEAGLRQGFELAKTPLPGFTGRRRVLLITDEQANIGATDPGSFMALATDASLAGVGLTTVGVGIDFNADFVRRVSSVSGGNAFWFGDPKQMAGTFEKDFDLMLTEVAFDMKLDIAPAPGFRIVKLYGVPGDSYAKRPDGGVTIDLPTLFFSRNRGAIFVSLAGDPAADAPALLGQVDLSYLPYGHQAPETERFEIRAVKERQAPLGLKRGELLVSEYEALEAASSAFYQNNRLDEAGELTAALQKKFAHGHDRELKKEGRLLEKVADFLADAEEVPEITNDVYLASTRSSPLVGVWTAQGEEHDGERWVFLASGDAVILSGEGKDMEAAKFKWSRAGVQSERGNLHFGVDQDGLFLAGNDRVDGKIRLRRWGGKT